MKRIVEPSLEQIVDRPFIEDAKIEKEVARIIKNVREEGDDALFYYNKKFDNNDSNSLIISNEYLEEQAKLIEPELKQAIDHAFLNIKKFHQSQLVEHPKVKIDNGITLWREDRAIQRVGIYVPGGTAALFSSLLMLALPAKIAGCEKIIVTTPINSDAELSVPFCYSAVLCEVDEVYQVGGAQAIAALAYGTETIKAVDKIFGPGNRYVTEAKSQVSKKCAIDMPAGPSEVMVVIDENSNYSFAASDLLSQAEHGLDSQVALVVYTSDASAAHKIIDEVETCLEIQLEKLSRKEIASEVINNSVAFVALDETKLIEIIDNWAAEHLILNCTNYHEVAKKIKNAASVFLGPYSCESAGDYASGTNHTLPTNFWAKSHSGISVESFLKRVSFQEINKEGLISLKDTIIALADAEGLDAHSAAVKIRVEGK